jgi:hypothetical protein
MKSSEGTLAAFATAPGQTALDGEGSNSPFTKALLNNLAAPNTEISVALTKVRAEVADVTKKKQSPWASTNLTGLFYMNPTASAGALRLRKAPAPAPQRQHRPAPAMSNWSSGTRCGTATSRKSSTPTSCASPRDRSAA